MQTASAWVKWPARGEAAPEPSKAEKIMGTAKTSPALDGKSDTPQQGKDGANSLLRGRGRDQGGG